jgi:dimethylargininase
MFIAFTRPVPRSIAQCELTHLQREPIDYERASRQHAEYEAALRSLGCEVVRLAGRDDYPDCVFIEDTAVVLDHCAVVTRPGAESRRGETEGVAKALSRYRQVTTIDAPGTLDGGDVLRVGLRVFVGLSSRTNEEGARQLARAIEPHGYTVRTVPVEKCLHLKTAVSALDDKRVLLDPALLDADLLDGVAKVEIDPAEPMAANVLALKKTVLCAAGAPRTRRRLEKQGFQVTPVDASELAKAEGGLTCCSLLLRV